MHACTKTCEHVCVRLHIHPNLHTVCAQMCVCVCLCVCVWGGGGMCLCACVPASPPVFPDWPTAASSVTHSRSQHLATPRPSSSCPWLTTTRERACSETDHSVSGKSVNSHLCFCLRIIMKSCQALTLWLISLYRPNIAQIMCMKVENAISH